jgi:hypothetical protein
MITLLGSLLGFVTSTGPSIFKTFMDAKQDTRDKEHELKLMAQQSQDKRDEALIDSVGQANIEVHKSSQQDSKRASRWVVNLSATVRPLVTYFFFLEFVLLTFLSAFGLISLDLFQLLWSESITGIFSVIISFWFGQRLVSKWTK